MEEAQIQNKLPSLYEVLLTKNLDAAIWKQLTQDFADLLWLNPAESDGENLIQGIISICDRIGMSLLRENEYFIVADLSRVKLFINDSLFDLAANKEKVKEVCLKSKKLMNDMLFFKTACKTIADTPDETFQETVVSIESAYKTLRNLMKYVTLQLERSIQSEYDKSFSELLNEIFYNEVLYPYKKKLKVNMETFRMVQEYKGNKFFSSSKYQGGNYNFYQKSENIYIGETNEYNKKEGYGKMYYANKDTYEGVWRNDKPEGKGLYLWKDGGKYLGEFKDGSLVGFGKRLYSGGNYYEGEFAAGKRSGKGRMNFKNGDLYEGEWHDEDMQGKGMYRWASGDSYVGEFKHDKQEGKGILTLNTGEIYEATWEKGSMKKEAVNI